MSNKFPIGSWNYPSINERGAEEVERWARCGITLTQSFRFSLKNDKKEKMIALLDECEKYDIKLILCVNELDFRAFTNEEEYRELFEKVYNDFGKHPAVYGFHIGDEPFGPEEIKKSMAATKIQKEIAPELTPFLNMNPWFSLYDDMVLGGKTLSDWAKEFSKEAKGSMVSYDRYSQMQYNNGHKDHWSQTLEMGINDYFRDFRLFMEAAKESGMELWFTGLSTSHFNYRPVSEDDVRWQLNTAAACGCRGMMWFFFYGMLHRNYRNAPVDFLNKETELYNGMARVHTAFQMQHGELLMKLKHKTTYCIGKSYGGYPLFTEETHPVIKKVETINGEPGILSFFEDEDGKEYCVLVNNTAFDAERFMFVLDKKVKKVLRIERNGESIENFAVSHHDAFYEEKEDAIKAGEWYAPGQMQIYCFE